MRNLFLSAAVALGMTATITPTTAQAQVDPYLGQLMTVGFNFVLVVGPWLMVK